MAIFICDQNTAGIPHDKVEMKILHAVITYNKAEIN